MQKAVKEIFNTIEKDEDITQKMAVMLPLKFEELLENVELQV